MQVVKQINHSQMTPITTYKVWENNKPQCAIKHECTPCQAHTTPSAYINTLHASITDKEHKQTNMQASRTANRQASKQADRHSDATTNRADIQKSKHTDKQLGQATTNKHMTTQDGTRREKTGTYADKQPYPTPD